MKVRLPRPKDGYDKDHQQQAHGIIEQALEQINPQAQAPSGGVQGAVAIKKTQRDYDMKWSTTLIVDPTTGALTLAAPTSGIALTVNGLANQYTADIVGAASQSLGLRVSAGTGVSDVAFFVRNQAGTLGYFEVRGDGLITGLGPTAGAQVDMTPDTGTFTLTYTGAGAQSGVATWRKMGNFIYLTLPSPTLNAGVGTTFGGNLPAAITPGFNQTIALPAGVFLDNGARLTTAIMTVLTNGTFTISNGTGAALVATGNRGIASTNPVVWWCLT